MPPYNFRSNDQLAFLGMGASRFGLNRSQGPWLVSMTGGGSALVQRSLDAIEGGVMFAPEMSSPVALKGSGAALTGQLALTALVNLQNSMT